MTTESSPPARDPFECPLPEVEIAPRATTTIRSARASSVGNLRPITIQLDVSLAESLLVHDVRVGKNSQLCCVGAVPATLFRRVQRPIPVFMDLIPSGLTMSLQVSNVTDEEVVFRGTLLATRKPLQETPLAMVGFGVTKVAAGETTEIVVRSQLAVKPRYLHVPPKILESFEVVSLTTTPYLDAPGSCGVDPASLSLQSLLSGGQITFEPITSLTLNDSVVLTVKNHTNVDRNFSAAMLGEVVGV